MSHSFIQKRIEEIIAANSGGGGGGGGIDPALMDAFNEALAEINPEFLHADFEGLSEEQGGEFQSLISGLSGEVGGQLGGIGNQLLGISQGDDPRFAAFRGAQLDLLSSQRERGAGDVSARLARSGIKGSAAQDELTRFGTGFDERARVFSSGLGLEQLGRQDRALSGAAGVFGSRAGILSGLAGQGFQGELAGIGSRNQALESELGAKSIGLQNLLAEPSFDIARTAAENAGKGGDSGGGGGGIFGTVLCTLAHEKGDLPEEVWQADAKYGQSVHPDILAGYRFWAVPLARQARKREWLYRIVKPLIIHWANQMHHEINPPFSYYGIAHDWPGWLLGRIGLPVCHLIGKLLNLKGKISEVPWRSLLFR